MSMDNMPQSLIGQPVSGGGQRLNEKSDEYFTFSKINVKVLPMRQLKSFTLAETLIILLIIAVLTVLSISILNLKNISQRDLLSRFDISFTKLDNMVKMAMFSSQKFNYWSSDQLAMSNLSCKKANGSDEANKSLCLKKALISISNMPKDCDDSIDNCVADFSKISNQLKEIFPSLKVQEMTAFTMPGGVTVLNSYLDSACQMNIPVNKAKNGDIEYVKGCGFLLVDVNGDKKPNNLLISKTEIVDRFLIALTANGLVKSNLLSELAGCPAGTRYDSATKTCTDPYVCSVSDMNLMKKIEAANPENLYSKQYPDGEAEHPDCYEINCLYGNLDPITNECPRKPTPCANSDEVREGGIWIKDGGDIPNKQEKNCCIKITNQSELAAIGTNSSALARDYCLMNDIYLTGNWVQLKGYVTGNFYGNGHIIDFAGISNVQPLFWYIYGEDKVIENLGLENVKMGFNTVKSNLKKIYTTGMVSASTVGNYVSGIVERLEGGKITDVYSSVSITKNGNSCGGGIVGSNGKDTTISNSYFNGDMTQAYAPQMGGLVGCSSGASNLNIINSYNKANIKGISSVTAAGGILGSIYLQGNSSVSNVYNIGTIADPSGDSYGGKSQGGIVGEVKYMNGNYILTINNAYNSGMLRNLNWSAGTIARVPSNITLSSQNVYNTIAFPDDSNNRFLNNTAYAYTPKNDGSYLLYSPSNSSTVKTSSDMLIAETFAAFNRSFWYVITGKFPTLQASIMPPQPHRDCRNDPNAHGGCFDVLNTQNAWDFNYVWAWKNPELNGETVSDPVFRWQCKPYKGNGYDCCRPSYAENEPSLDICPVLTGTYSNKINY